MSDSPAQIELEEFEVIPAAPGTALLRITARVPAWAPREPTLLIRDDVRVHRVRPLPLPREPEGWLRAAYSVRTAVLERNPSFALELSQGAVFELPEPHGRIHGSRPRREAPLASQAPLASHPPRPAPQPQRTQSPDLARTRVESSPVEQADRSDPRKLVELEARVLEANRWALAAQREAERLSARVRELERALQDADRLELIRHTARERARAQDEAEVRAALAAHKRRS